MRVPQTAIVLVGGQGTRLRSILAGKPKPLAWVAGKPFLSHLLDDLWAKGIKTVVLAVGYQADMIASAYGENYRGLSLQYSLEREPAGTGGALAKAAAFLEDDEELVLVCNGDSFCEFDLEQLLHRHRENHARFSLVVHETRQAGRFGIPEITASGQVAAFREKTEEIQRKNAGVYLTDAAWLRSIDGSLPLSLETDLLPVWVEAGVVAASLETGRFIDIGLPATWMEAQAFFGTAIRPAFLAMDALVRFNPQCASMLNPDDHSPLTGWKLAVGAIVRNVEGHILLEQRMDCGLWALLGGRMDLGESIEQTLHREVLEETGLQVRIERLVGIYSEPKERVLAYPNGDVVQPVTIVFECLQTGGQLAKSPESLSLTYFSPTELPAAVIPQAQDALEDCLSYHSPQVR